MRKVFPPIPDSWRKSSWQCGSANMDALVVTPRCKSRFGSVGAQIWMHDAVWQCGSSGSVGAQMWMHDAH